MHPLFAGPPRSNSAFGDKLLQALQPVESKQGIVMARAAAAARIAPAAGAAVSARAVVARRSQCEDVRQAVAGSKNLAYTTVMTLLERLARKGLVSRRKVGRSFLYTPQAPRDTLRRIALREFLDAYFDGSEEQLREFLQGSRVVREFEPEQRLDTALTCVRPGRGNGSALTHSSSFQMKAPCTYFFDD